VRDVRRAGSRFTTKAPGITTRHSFSYGQHYDPANVGHAALVAHNDDLVQPGQGYDLHPHADLEIVTWVLSGSLVHADSEGHRHVVGPGQVQRLSAGTGVRHSERNDASGAVEPTRFVQMWVLPDESGLPPSYALASVEPSGLTPLASGITGLDAGVRIHTDGVALHVARLAPGETVTLPDALHLHVFAAQGSVDLEAAGRLDEGDAARFRAEGGPRLRAVTPAEVLVWQLP
jgi:redox-sensitive bicupin YhaK (pirin superfamily)